MREIDRRPSDDALVKRAAAFCSRLVREWPFEFDGGGCRSLSQIACEITGAYWSAPGVSRPAKRMTAAGEDALPAPGACYKAI